MTNNQAELLNIYRSTPVVLRALLRTVPDATTRVTGDGEEAWSIVEIICHLRDAEATVLERVRLMLAQDNPFLAAYDQAALAEQAGYREQSLQDALAGFIRLREEQIGLLEALDESQWARSGMHEEAGETSVESLTLHMAAHDVVHLAQISRRMLAGAG